MHTFVGGNPWNTGHICDMCKTLDGRLVLHWKGGKSRQRVKDDFPGEYPQLADPLYCYAKCFSLCVPCITELYLQYAAPEIKQTEKIIMRRKQVSEILRNTILQRDQFKCVSCGSSENLVLDHIIPFTHGGTTDPSNLQTLCKKCNTDKRDRRVLDGIRRRKSAGKGRMDQALS